MYVICKEKYVQKEKQEWDMNRKDGRGSFGYSGQRSLLLECVMKIGRGKLERGPVMILLVVHY